MSKLILSLDGGGIRGAATAHFLALIEKKLKADHQKTLRDCIDFYAGTSTGSIIALALSTTSLEMAEISELYNLKNAKRIFEENQGWFELDGINAPKYESQGKLSLLKSKLGTSKVGSVPRQKHVLAVTYSIEQRKPVVIKSTDPSHRKLPSWVVADASSAAPTYFPTKETKLHGSDNALWLVDGGVTANNPTMCAIAEAIKAWPNESLHDLRVLSVGTGYRTRKINGPESQKWGALEWFLKGHILDLLSDERVVAYQARTIISDGNYIRVNAEMKEQTGLPNPPDDAMDDISESNLRKLKQMGEFWFEKYGASVSELLTNSYLGPSKDRIEAATGKPKVNF